jgi:hypothetical protein
MKTVKVKDQAMQAAAQNGMDDFLKAIVDATYEAVGGVLTSQAMEELSAEQITLLAYMALRDEVMDGGFIQLIYNGYGDFIFRNPFAKAIKAWGLDDLSRLIRKVHPIFAKRQEEICQVETDEEFMALFEQMPDFENFDDTFVENEENWTEKVACYVDEHIQNFVVIEN